jgi:hypothetical protein
MPSSLYKQLAQGPKIRKERFRTRNGRIIEEEYVDGETKGVLPILRRLIDGDPYVKRAYLCHPSVKQIGKEKNEGGFCGFRNIQMQISYLQGTEAPGSQHFPGRTPGILDLQDHIEEAWDNEIHWFSRQQIGKLRGTRKWIGTLEVSKLSTVHLYNLILPSSRHMRFTRTLAFHARSTSLAIREGI